MALTKIYHMGEVEVAALRGVDFEIFEDEFVVLVGSSGSSKSMLLNVLVGLMCRLPAWCAIGITTCWRSRSMSCLPTPCVSAQARACYWTGGVVLRPGVALCASWMPVAFTKVSALGVEEQLVLVIVDIVSPPNEWKSLGTGYRLEASFILWEKSDVLQVPEGALFRHGDAWAVFAVKDGRAALTPVRIGERNGLAAQILAGLREGASVIIHPSDQVMDGMPVAVE